MNASSTYASANLRALVPKSRALSVEGTISLSILAVIVRVSEIASPRTVSPITDNVVISAVLTVIEELPVAKNSPCTVKLPFITALFVELKLFTVASPPTFKFLPTPRPPVITAAPEVDVLDSVAFVTRSVPELAILPVVSATVNAPSTSIPPSSEARPSTVSVPFVLMLPASVIVVPVEPYPPPTLNVVLIVAVPVTAM